MSIRPWVNEPAGILTQGKRRGWDTNARGSPREPEGPQGAAAHQEPWARPREPEGPQGAARSRGRPAAASRHGGPVVIVSQRDSLNPYLGRTTASAAGRYSVGSSSGHIYSSPRNDERSSPGTGVRPAAEAGDYPGIWDLPGRCGGLAVRLRQGGGDKRFRRIGVTDMIPTTPVLGRFID
jgi:hypothetical protein